MFFQRLLAFILVGLVTGTATCAATSSSIVDPLDSLREALVTAWQQHPVARAAQAKLEAARARARASGRSVYNPEVELAADHEGPDRLRTIGLSQTLDLSDKRKARNALGGAELTLAEAEYSLQHAEFSRDWLGAWARVLAGTRQIEFGEQRVTLANRLARLAERQFVVGDISAPERDLVLLASDEALADQASLVADAATAREAFAKVGGSNAAPLPALPTDPPPPSQPTTAMDVTDLPEWQLAAAQAQSAQRRVTVAERDRRADPTVSLHGGRIESGGASGNIVNMSVSVPLFIRNNYRAETDAARAEADSADALVQSKRLELLAHAQSTATTYAATRDAWLRWHRSRGTDLAKRSNALERLWTAGELSTSDYVLQLKQSLDTALAGAALEGHVWQSYFDYLYAVGQLDEWTRQRDGP